MTHGYVFDLHRKKPKRWPMSQRIALTNGRRLNMCSVTGHDFAGQKGPMVLFVQTIGIVSTTIALAV